MDVIKDIANALSRYDVRDIEVISNKEYVCEKEASRYREFYLGLREKTWTAEEEIATHFNYASKNDKGFRRLKEGVLERLMNSILFVDLSGKEFTDFHRKVQEMYKLWLVAENLHRRGALIAYFDIAEKALSLAVETEILPAIIELSRGLKVFYAIRPRHRKDFIRLSIIFEQYWPMFQAEVEAQDDFLFFISNCSEKKGFGKKFAKQAAQLFHKYEDKIGQYHNVLFNVYARLFQLYAKTLVHDWEGGCIAANQALDFLVKKKDRNREYIYLFSTQKASCLMMLQRYGDAKNILDSIVDLIPEGKPSWFKNREIAVVNAFYAEKYEEASEIVFCKMGHPQFKVVNEVDQETWRLYKGFLFLLIRSGKLSLPKVTAENQAHFRVGKWMNEMPIYSQDKRGGNIPLLILQLHFIIQDVGNNPELYDEVCNRAEALRKYAYRNFGKTDEHFRTDCFVSLLQLLVRNWYLPKELDVAEKPVLKKMSAIASDLVDNSFETEIVPYERQWQWIRETVRRSVSK